MLRPVPAPTCARQLLFVVDGLLGYFQSGFEGFLGRRQLGSLLGFPNNALSFFTTSVQFLTERTKCSRDFHTSTLTAGAG